MTHANPAVTLSARIPPEIRVKLDELSQATGRTKSFLAAEAIENYLTTQSWQVKAIKEAVRKADSKDAEFIDHDQVGHWVDSWGSKDEKDMP